MKVAIATKWIDEAYTGVGLYTRQLVEALLEMAPAENLELTLVHKAPSQDPVYQRAREVRYKALPGPLWVMSQEKALRRVSGEVDLVHEPYIGVRSRLSVPSVAMVHDTMPLDFPQYSPASFRAYFRRVMPKVLERASAVLVNSNRTKEDVLRHFSVPREKVHAVYLGSDHMAAPGPEAQEVRKALGLAGVRYFLAVGTSGTKNLPLTIAAFQHFRQEVDKGVRLVVAGKLPPEAVRAAAVGGAAPGAIVELGHVGRDKLPALYAGALAVVCPSLYEGFGFVPLEAMRVGTPAVVSDRGSLPEVCGNGALTVPIEDPARLSRAMARVLEPAVREKLIAAGRARAATFTWRNTAVGTLMVYRRALERPRESPG